MSETRIRYASPDDGAGVARVHVDAWRTAYRGLIDQELLDRLDVTQRAAGWTRWIKASDGEQSSESDAIAPHRLLVAERGGEILGWASLGAGRDEGLHDRGELAGLYVHPQAWGTGLGHALLATVENELREHGFRDAYLWVLHGNERAIRFYESHQWRASGHNKVMQSGNQTLNESRHDRTL